MTSKRARPQITLPVTVEFEDVDSFRIAHHTKLVAYLERARVRFLDRHGIDLTRTDPHPVLYDLEVRFKKPARFRDAIEVSVFVESADGFRLILGYRVTRDAELLLKARTCLAFVDAASGRMVPLPQDYAALAL
ncbi:MAG: acyl-CoA thioesterase [Myxococcota bacterium]|jgi:acyl-CoA thioester hydrolase|nr:acyl-CoA thioesterase [Myxococcota bacterium]